MIIASLIILFLLKIRFPDGKPISEIICDLTILISLVHYPPPPLQKYILLNISDDFELKQKIQAYF